MADNKLSELTAAASAGATDILYLVQSSTSKSITTANLFTSIAANVIPATADFYNLGSNTKPWKDVYISSGGMNGRLLMGNVTVSASASNVLTITNGSNTLVSFSGGTSTGLRVPHLTNSQVNSLSGKTGDIVYDVTSGNVRLYNGTSWANITLS